MGGAVKKQEAGAPAGAKPGADLIFTFDGARGAVAPKLAAFLAGHHTAQTTRRQRVVTIAAVAAVASVAAGIFIHPGLGVFGAVVVLIGFAVAWSGVLTMAESLDRGGDVRHALVELLDDIHPRARVRGHVDLRQPSEKKPYRTRTSPYSNASKLDYRHRWFEVRAPLVDGGFLAVELTSLMKTKGGSAIRREIQLRGRYRLPAGTEVAGRREVEVVHAPPPRLRGPATVPTADAAQVGEVKVRAVARPGGGVDVVFWGRLEDPDQVPGVLAAVGRYLGRARLGGPRRDGGAVGRQPDA